MLIHAGADIPLQSESLVQALREFAVFVQQQLSAGQDAEISIAIGETGARANKALARSLPDDTKEFSLGPLPSASPLTGAQFRESIAFDKPKKTISQVRVSAAAVPDLLALLDGLAEALPPSGRGILLLVHLAGWRIAGDPAASAIDATFSRFRHGAQDISATAGLRFHALSLKDPSVAETIAAASRRMHLRFGKPLAAFAAATNAPAQMAGVSDPRLQPPTSEAELVVLQSFDEAMARAAALIGARPEDLESIPLLFSHGRGFDKRMHDVMAGKKENLSLPSHLKHFMKDRFSDYLFEAADPGQLRFRKPVAPTLDLLLIFDKVHLHGLGKTFTVAFAADFPNTPFGGMHTGWWGGTRKNIFWMFHQDWEQRVWAYTTSAELATALQGCGELLRRVLPAVEEQCRRLLLPPPATLPVGITEHGALSAREAYGLVVPMAREWAGDVELESVSSSTLLSIRHQAGSALSSITEDGRLRPEGRWGLKFVSKRLDRYCYYVVPHTGRVWWSFHPVLQGAIPKYSAVLESDDWIDSTAVAPRAFQALEQQLGNLRVDSISLALHEPARYSGNFMWEAHCIALGASLSERRAITVQLDRRTGTVLGASVYPGI